MDAISKPPWLKIKLPQGEKFGSVKATLQMHGLVTVCEEAHCPNIAECWGSGTATFMVLGDTCTRGCRFCAVKKEAMGAPHFAQCIRTMKKVNPGVIVEVLIPDFRGDEECIRTIADAKPHVIGQNLETVKRLQAIARDRRANYEQTLGVLRAVKELDASIYTKSAVMLGLGESEEEVCEAMEDLRAVGCDIFYMGQYLRPSARHLEVKEYVSPEKFERLKRIGEEKGFLYVAAGPFVRSSYKAGEYFMQSLVERGKVGVEYAH